jgi:hypothetical protein
LPLISTEGDTVKVYLRISFPSVVLTGLLILAFGLNAKSCFSQASTSIVDAPLPRADVFTGYSILGINNSITTTRPNVHTESYSPIYIGGIVGVSYYFDRNLGLEFEYAVHPNGPNDGVQSLEGGMIYRFPHANLVPYVHGLVGVTRMGGPNVPSLSLYHDYTIGYGFTGGGGLDTRTRWLGNHLGFRLVQIDYDFLHAAFPFDGVTMPSGGTTNSSTYRLSSGLLWNIHAITPAVALQYSCAASPSVVFAGDPVTVTGAAANLNPKRTALYTWSGTGVTGSGSTASVTTGSLAPGNYTVNGSVSEGSKSGQSANCLAAFTVKEYEPPTITCSVSPATIRPGDTAALTATAISPQNRALTYSYTASAGTVDGAGSTATYSSNGAATGLVSITCQVADDKGHSASSSTGLTIEPPPLLLMPKTQTLCSISFTNDKKRPTRVDNEAKACLDQVALTLQQQPNARLVVVGESSATEKAAFEKQRSSSGRQKKAAAKDFAAQRAVNTKEYLVQDSGIDASRISVATGADGGLEVENYLVPSGANFTSDITGTTPADEVAVKPEARKHLPVRHSAAKVK